LTNTFKDFGHISELVLIRAVGYDDENTESTSEIFDSFGLTGSGGTSGSTTIHHTKGLRKSDVASISKRGDTETFFGPEELVLINEFDISNSDGNSGFLVLPVATSVL